MIKKEGKYWVVRSHRTRKSLGKYRTKKAAQKRLNQIIRFKKKNKYKD